MQEELYLKIRKPSARYTYYLFFDTTPYLADQIFIRHEIRVRFGKEFVKEGSPYRGILCCVRKKDAPVFESCMIYATLSFNGQEELLFPPEEDSAINKAVRRLGAGELSDCDVTLERCQVGTLANLYESVYQAEGLRQMNQVMRNMEGIDPDKEFFFAHLLESTGVRSSENITLLAEHIDDYYLIPEDNATDVAQYILSEDDEYHADVELWDFIDMDAFGEYYIRQHGAVFVEDGLLCSSNGSSVREILERMAPEPGLHLQQ